MSQWISERFMSANGPSSGSAETNRTAAGNASQFVDAAQLVGAFDAGTHPLVRWPVDQRCGFRKPHGAFGQHLIGVSRCFSHDRALGRGAMLAAI
jgi:hypothetical protein